MFQEVAGCSILSVLVHVVNAVNTTSARKLQGDDDTLRTHRKVGDMLTLGGSVEGSASTGRALSEASLGPETLGSCPDDATVDAVFPFLAGELNSSVADLGPSSAAFFAELLADEAALREYFSSSCEAGTIDKSSVEDLTPLAVILEVIDEDSASVATCRDNSQALEGYTERRTAMEQVCTNAENNSPEGASCSGSGRILSQECMNSFGDVWMIPNSKMEAIVSKYRLVYDACSAITDEERIACEEAVFFHSTKDPGTASEDEVAVQNECTTKVLEEAVGFASEVATLGDAAAESGTQGTATSSAILALSGAAALVALVF